MNVHQYEIFGVGTSVRYTGRQKHRTELLMNTVTTICRGVPCAHKPKTLPALTTRKSLAAVEPEVGCVLQRKALNVGVTAFKLWVK
jgi:hypothetical protein